MSNPLPPQNRDFGQVLQESYDADLNRIRVDALVSDGTDALVINPDGSISTRIFDSNGAAITLGEKTAAFSIPVALPTDRPINVDFDPSTTLGTIESGTFDSSYNEVLAVGSGVETSVVTYTGLQPSRLKIIEMTGTNIAAYTVYLNGTPIHKKRTYFGNLDNAFQFSKGYPFDLGDLIEVKVLHNQSSPGDFAGFILVLRDDP